MELYYPEDQSEENLQKIRRDNVCAECGRPVRVFMDFSREDRKCFIGCPTPEHRGIVKEYQPSRWAEAGLDSLTHEAKEEQMVEEHGEAITRELVARGLPLSGQLTRPQAKEIVMTIWKNAPEIEVYKATALCADFGLHPLMRHIYLIKYNRYNRQRQIVGEDWSIQLGIGATRVIAQRKHHFSYMDDTPRRANEEEGKKILGEDYKPEENIYGITKLKDMDSKAEVTGIGSFAHSEPDPKGMEKGNSRLNMACIRSERRAIDRQYPAEMPTGYEVVDERYQETASGKADTTTGEIQEEAGKEPKDIVEGQFREVKATETPVPEPEPEPEPEPKAAAKTTKSKTKDESQISEAQAAEMKNLIETTEGFGMPEFGAYCNKDMKWGITKIGDLKVWQYEDIKAKLEKGKS